MHRAGVSNTLDLISDFILLALAMTCIFMAKAIKELTSEIYVSGPLFYQETGCGWTHGTVDHSSASDILRKMEGIR